MFQHVYTAKTVARIHNGLFRRSTLSAVYGQLLLLLLLLASVGAPAYAIRGSVDAHDPSSIIKDGNKYWVFSTGPGIPSKYSTDLLNWTSSSRPVFTTATQPAWINSKVPGFANEYWAPECIFMNGKFYLYYSCSTFGSQVSGIGVATNVTLDPASPNYNWVDEGEVVSSTATGSSNPNAIDPAVYRDTNNNVWFIYGSFFGGIRTLQLNPVTGKPLNGTQTQQFAVANGGVEAAYVKQRGGYYYLFINRGNCCQGSNSTYYIQVGRSTSPSGPFLDRNGVDLNNNGGSTLLSTAGRYVGPGHAGIFEENGVSYFSHHYYDLDNSGQAKLDVAKLSWDATEWPIVSRNWLSPGRYTISNANSNLYWQSAACTAAAGQRIIQSAPNGLDCQQWDFTVLTSGTYQVVGVRTGQAVGTENCSTSSGAPLQLEPASGSICQEFQLERAHDGTFVFGFFNRVVEPTGSSTTPNSPLQLSAYNASSTSQRWTISQATPLAAAPGKKLSGVSIYPVPAEHGSFTVDMGDNKAAEKVTVVVFNLQGQEVYRRAVEGQNAKLVVETALRPGVYQVRVQRNGGYSTHKVSVL
ncbi:family 43 glycosylhydrolase [Hymenobacter sp. YC55]|uniref:family 43 glycosylhydrolase n=1 Tax=Hymenobacter sp. YC55 TaxID=3034019 RepID=UPI0023F7CA19|nr:family 43 glycosylhydrolase [Hymenobacter sp. YC55]MDF7810603.1 family 43 glycosylhydrolase [Hymenobacter sp. YC55]